jgi:hypothetical protein
MNYETTVSLSSALLPGVSFTIARVSFARRLELTRRVREIGGRIDFHRASENVLDQIDAALLAAEVEKVYLEWGLTGLSGLQLDGKEADPALLISKGPEALCKEIVAAIKRECGLTDEERKN